MEHQALYEEKRMTLESCLALIENGDTIGCGGVNCEPFTFLHNFHTIVPRLHDVTVVKGMVGPYRFLTDPATAGHVKVVGHFYSAPFRAAHKLGITECIPSDLHNHMQERIAYKSNNVFVCQVADMENGCFQVPYTMMFEQEIYEAADKIILEVNPKFKRVKGGLDIPVEKVTGFFHAENPFYIIPRSESNDMVRTIGRYVADLIPDGSCIQLGIGALPDTVGEYLKEKNDLGIHTEMLSSTMADLIELGNATGKRKTLHPNEHICTFAQGDEHLYEVMATHPNVRIVPSAYGNHPFVIAQNDNMVSVNTCLDIDLTGQICSESIGPMQFSGTGGATDFAYGAIHSKGGRGIVAFASTAKGGSISKIKSILTPGAAVSISRNCADTIITEYGVAELRGRTIRERADALIAIAHPDFRAQLRKEAKEYGII